MDPCSGHCYIRVGIDDADYEAFVFVGGADEPETNNNLSPVNA